ncbi:MAG: hypothetical protein U0528_02520 [Anaerolineae bacterium]
MPTAKLQMALLIDGDNAQPSLTQSLLEALENYGRCVIRRVYGDWTAEGDHIRLAQNWGNTRDLTGAAIVLHRR